MKQVLTSIFVLILNACAVYTPSQSSLSPEFSSSEKIDITYTINANARVTNTLEKELSTNPFINSFSNSQSRVEGKYHIDINMTYTNTGDAGLFLPMISLGLIPSSATLERQIEVTVTAPDGFPAGKQIESIVGENKIGWITLFQGGSMNPAGLHQQQAQHLVDQFRIALYKLKEKGAFEEYK